MYAVRITADRDVSIVPFPEFDTYDFLNESVGGWIEAVDFDYPVKGTLWLNEEGKIMGLPYNLQATLLVESYLFVGDYIVGNCVVTGLPDDEGNTTGLTLKQAGDIVRVITL